METEHTQLGKGVTRDWSNTHSYCAIILDVKHTNCIPIGSLTGLEFPKLIIPHPACTKQATIMV